MKFILLEILHLAGHFMECLNWSAQDLLFLEMKGISWGVIIGISIGVIIGLLLAIAAWFCIKIRKRHAQIRSSSSRRAATIPIRENGADSCTILSDSTIGQESPKPSDGNGMSLWLEGPKRKSVVSVSGIPKYPYKYACFILFFSHQTEKKASLFLFYILS